MDKYFIGYPDRFDTGMEMIETKGSGPYTGTVNNVLLDINKSNEPLVQLSSNIHINELDKESYTYNCDALKGQIDQTQLSEVFFYIDINVSGTSP